MRAERPLADSGHAPASKSPPAAHAADAHQQQQQHNNLNWSTRLAAILVGASVLFSLFYGTDMLFQKVSSYTASSPPHNLVEQPFRREAAESKQANASSAAVAKQHSSAQCALVESRVNWARFALASQPHKHTKAPRQQSRRGDLIIKDAIDFDLIYENELRVDESQMRYVLGDAQHSHQRQVSVVAGAQLRRLLHAYNVAMPFNPDIWRISEPAEHMHLLSGELGECALALDAIARQLERARRLAANRRDSIMYVQGAQHYKLMQLMDSFGRPEAGALHGHPFWMGAFLECERVGQAKPLLRLGANMTLKTRYCIGKLGFLQDDADEEATSNTLSIKVGLCLPASCDSLALFKHATSDSRAVDSVREQIERLMWHNFDERVWPRHRFSLRDVHCLPDDTRRPMSSGARVLLCLILAWLCALAGATWLRRQRTQFGVSRALLDALAIDANLARFVGFRELATARSYQQFGTRSAHVNLNVLDSVKHLGCAGVIAAHVLLTYLTLGSSYRHTIEQVGGDLRTMLLLSLNNIVDTFFVISGLLVSYLMFKRADQTASVAQADKQTSKTKLTFVREYVRVVARRYVRMAPLYLLVYAWVKCLAVHIGSGPLWDYATSRESLRGMCHAESWLWPLAFASDFKPITQHCVPPAWSVAADLQFFLVAPLFLALLGRSQRAGYALLATLVVVSTCRTLIDYKSLLDYVTHKDFAKLRLHVFTLMIGHAAHAYNQPQNRIGPFLIGLIGGYLLRAYERRRERNDNGRRAWPACMRGAYFKCVCACALALMLAPCLVQVRERARANAPLDWWWRPAGELLAALNTSHTIDCYLALGGFVLIKPLWTVCNCVVFLRLATDLRHSLVARLMAMDVWRVLCKLNYAILLVHYEFIAYEAMSRLQLAPITWTDLVCKFAFAYLCSLPAAALLYVLFEQPAQQLTNWLLFANNQPPPPSKVGQETRNSNNSNAQEARATIQQAARH